MHHLALFMLLWCVLLVLSILLLVVERLHDFVAAQVVRVLLAHQDFASAAGAVP